MQILTTHSRRKGNLFRQILPFATILSISLMLVVAALYTLQSSGIKCCRHFEMVDADALDSIDLFEDVLFADRQPQIDKTIFFIESKLNTGRSVNLSPRQVCAIESAARANPNWDIFVLFASPVGLAKDSSLHPPLVNVLKAYPNVFFRSLYFWSYAAGTPFEKWLDEGDLFKSDYVVEHTADCLRFMTMYRFGGLYMDLDVIVQKSFENIKLNFFGCESEYQVESAIMSFTRSGFGHEIAERCARDFVSNFNGTLWDNNGPGVITRVLQKLCKTENALKMTREQCSGFNVYPPSTFYAVSWRNWNWLFDSEFTNKTLELIKDSVAVHVWNKLSYKAKVSEDVAYGIIAKAYCPNVYEINKDNL